MVFTSFWGCSPKWSGIFETWTSSTVISRGFKHFSVYCKSSKTCIKIKILCYFPRVLMVFTSFWGYTRSPKWSGILEAEHPLQSLREVLKGQCYEIFDFWFFHESVFSQTPENPLGPFRIFSKTSGFTLRISPQIYEQKFEMILMLFSRTWGKMIHQKTWSKKPRDIVPLNSSPCPVKPVQKWTF
jgi:hypothetical protein